MTMTEIADQSFFNAFENTSKALSDPVVEAGLQQAREINVALRNGTLTRQEAAEYMRIFDQEWYDRGLMGEEMIVNGATRFYQEFHVEDEGSTLMLHEGGYNPQFIAEDKPMISKGFIIEQHDGVAALKLLGVCPAAPGDSQGNVSDLTFGIDLSMVNVDFPALISYERAQAWLEEFYPDLIAEIDERLLTHDGDSATSIISLKGIDLSAVDESGDAMLRTCQALHRYVNHIINPDQALPYAVSCNGYVGFPTDNGAFSYLLLESERDLMQLRAVTVQQFPTDTGELRLQFAVAGEVGGQEEGSLSPAVVSVESMTALYSIWSVYYDN